FVAIGVDEEEAEWLNAFSRPQKQEIFWIHLPIPKIGRALIAWKKSKSKSIKIVLWLLGQIWFTHLLAGSSRYLHLGESSLIPNPGKEMTKRKDMLPPGKIAAFFIDQGSNKNERMKEMTNIDLFEWIIDNEDQTAATCFSPKQSKKRERYYVRRTDDSRVSPKETFFVWFTRLREHFQQCQTDFINQFWTENWEQSDQRYISTRLLQNQLHWESQREACYQINPKQKGEERSPNDHENAKGQKLLIKKDDQEIKPQEEAQDSSMTKNSDRVTTAESQT
ncbi:MAG: hypothetical protein EZS28_024474, partial [Streblomastix strix]